MRSPFTLVCSVTVAASAFLVFLLEPMFAKMAMPLLGGAANVWIAAMMFYQVALLAGYLYAHILGFAPLRLQWPLHLAFSIAALLDLPLAIPLGWAPPGDANPAPALFLMMAGAIGAPFVVLSATASLAQRWFALARPNDNPYLLYAFSNAGSFAALIAYPLVVEPYFSLTAQAQHWSYGYAAVIGALFLIGWAASRAPAPQKAQAPVPAAPLSMRLVLRWICLAAAPSSLLLSFTSFLTVDVGSLPLLWVLILALYLATFIIAFSSKSETFGRPARLYYPILLIAACIGLVPVFAKIAPTSPPMMAVYLIAYVGAALGCHSELARSKPEASRLTLFFLIVAFGGALGGVFNSLVAPLIFTDIVEFPLGLILAALLIGTDGPPGKSSWAYAFAALAAALIAAAVAWPEPLDPDDIGYALVFRGLLAAAALTLVRVRGDRRVLASGAAACVGLALFLPTSQRLVFAERNFYGVNRVRDLAASDLRRMEHGDTIHGLLALDKEHRLTPLGYYNPMGGLAQTTLAINAGRAAPKIALVGLGAGEMVCIGDKDWRYDIYEIDPGVIRVASDATLFPFLSECAARHRIIQGDGRLKLREAQNGEYDQIILDAFTSDAIPTHLLTREALVEYLAKLKPDGVLTLHLSNRYFNLAPVVAAEARDLGLSSLGNVSPSGVIGADRLPVFPTLAVNLSRDAKSLAPLAAAGWRRLRSVPDAKGWTDNWSDVLGALMWAGKPIEPFEDGAQLRGTLTADQSVFERSETKD